MGEHDLTRTGPRLEGEKRPADLPPGLKIFLEVIEGPDRGLKHEIVQTMTSMGRKGTDLVLNDSTISSRHASLEVHREDILLYDNNSTNGTLVNGEKISSCPLKNMDEIQLGETKLLLSVVQDKYGIYAEDFAAGHTPGTGLIDRTRVRPAGLAPNPELPAGLQVILDVGAGPHRGERIHLKQRSTILGRQGADVALNDDMVSARHAQIEVHSKDKITIKDLASTNGTTVNDQPASAVKLRHGDVIAIGDTVMTLVVHSG